MSGQLDYIYPGTVFVCLGILSCINSFYLLLTGKVLESGLCQSVTINARSFVFPLESFARTLLCIIGILIEVLTSSENDSFLRSQDSQEMLVYCFYMFATFCECASILTLKIDRKVCLTSYGVASLLEGYVAYHFVEGRQNSCITMCWTLIAVVQGIAFMLQAVQFNNTAVVIIKNTFLLLHGTWFYHIAFSSYLYPSVPELENLYPLGKNPKTTTTTGFTETSTSGSSPPTSDLSLDTLLEESLEKETVKVSSVAFDFALHLLCNYMLTVILFFILSVFLNNELGDAKNAALRPLVHDDCSDSEANEDAEAGLGGRDGLTEQQMSVSKFGI